MANATAGSQSPRQIDALVASRIARLSPGQLDCLRLGDQHLSSKEIAVELHISPHTVDQRIRGALQILGVDRRTQAARLVSSHRGPYQRLIHQPPHVEPDGDPLQRLVTVSHQIRHADRAGGPGMLGSKPSRSRRHSDPPCNAVRNEEQPPE